MTVIPELPELPGTGGYRTIRHLPPEVLNSAPYVRPGAVLTYPTTITTETRRPARTEPVCATLTVVHVEGCHKLAQAPTDQRGQWTGTGEDMHFAMRFGPTEEFTWCEACMSHRLSHVVLPSGERRYRPAAPVGVTHHGEPTWARFAVAAIGEDGGWHVATWTVALAEAEFIAQGWPTMAVVLDPGQWPSEEAA
ncbi:hypothetical protein AB0392_34125 [Nonomuraea angiospora]|uniref:hypothetical protein n=1 Tax=Nonomuraea angiospora TaxID=46172 RepID=UPI00344B3F1E